MVRDLATYLTGWRGYFGYCQTPSVLTALDSWIQRRLRCAVWKQWKRGRRRFAALRARGVGRDLAAQTAGSPHGPWHLSLSPALSYRASVRLLSVSRPAPPGGAAERLTLPNRRVRTRMHGGVTGEAGDRPPMSILTGTKPDNPIPLTRGRRMFKIGGGPTSILNLRVEQRFSPALRPSRLLVRPGRMAASCVERVKDE